MNFEELLQKVWVILIVQFLPQLTSCYNRPPGLPSITTIFDKAKIEQRKIAEKLAKGDQLKLEAKRNKERI